MLTLLWPFIKTFAPFFLIGTVFAMVYFQGYHAGKAELVEYRAAVQAETNLHQRKLHETETELQQAQEQITAQAEANRASIADAHRAANDALQQRMQRDRAACHRRAMSDASQPARDDASETAGLFLESAGSRLVERAAEADEINESLRICQSSLMAWSNLLNQR